MHMKKFKHGGRRKGSGRKKLGRKSYTLRMKPEVMALLKVASKGQTVGRFIEKIAANGQLVTENTKP